MRSASVLRTDLRYERRTGRRRTWRAATGAAEETEGKKWREKDRKRDQKVQRGYIALSVATVTTAAAAAAGSSQQQRPMVSEASTLKHAAIACQ